MDEHPVTNAEFPRFVKATSYRTVAERPPNPADYPSAGPKVLVPGSLVFRPPPYRVSLYDYRAWWAHLLAAPRRTRQHPAWPRPAHEHRPHASTVRA